MSEFQPSRISNMSLLWLSNVIDKILSTNACSALSQPYTLHPLTDSNQSQKHLYS